MSRFLPENGIRLWGKYKSHPDPRQEAFFFGLVKECLANGMLTEAQLKKEMAANHVRHDALEVVARVPSVDEVLGGLKKAA